MKVYFLLFHVLLALISINEIVSQSTPSYLLIIGSNQIGQRQINLPLSQFTTNKYSFSFWFRFTRPITQRLITHQFTTANSATSGQALAINYIITSNTLNISPKLKISPTEWNFIYVGVNCTENQLYFTSMSTGDRFDESLDLFNQTFGGQCFTSSLSSLTLTIGDSTISSLDITKFANFRYFPSILVTKNAVMREYISQEIDPWLWLRFSPSEISNNQQELIDYARGNLVLKGLGYNQESFDSSVVKVYNKNYTYGNFFNNATYTTAYVDYLGPSFTFTMRIALNPSNIDTSERIVVAIDDTDYPDKSRLQLGISPNTTNGLQYSLFLIVSNETYQQRFGDPTSLIQFNNSTDNNVTEWLLLIFKIAQFDQSIPSFISWEVYDNSGNLRTNYKVESLLKFTGEDPLFQFGGFNGFLTDVRVYKGTAATLTQADSILTANIPSCKVAIGSLYQNFTVNPSNTNVTSSLTCLVCSSGTYSYSEIAECKSYCPLLFEGDPSTNLCKCVKGDCIESLKCHPTCRKCDGISNENCRTCADNLFLSPSLSSCSATCPTNYCPINDVIKAGICTLCDQFEPGASLVVINGSYVELQFTSDMNITNNNIAAYVFLNMAGYTQSGDYDLTYEKITDRLYALKFEYYKTLPLRALEVTFTNPLTLLDHNGYHLSTQYTSLNAQLPSTFSPTQTQLDKAENFKAWALYIFYFMLGSFPILWYTGDLGIFWGMIDSAQIMNYLLYVNFSLPFNIKQIFEAMSVANLQFIPNLIWEILIASNAPIDLSDQQAPDNFVTHGILYVSFLYNAGRIISVYIVLGILFSIVSLLSHINFESEERKEIFKKIRGWMTYAIIRMFLVGYLQLVFAVVLQVTYPSYKDAYSMVSVVLAMVFGIFVVWLPINIIINIEKIYRIQKKTNKNVDSYLKNIILEYRFEFFISRNFVFFLLLRNIALVIVLVFLPSIPLTQSASFLDVSLLVSLWIAAMPIYNSPSYTIINLVALAGFGVIGIALFWMLANNTFNDQAQLAETNFDIGEIMAITCLIVLLMYTLHVFWQILRIGWQFWVKFSANRENRRKEMGLELSGESSKSPSKISLLDGTLTRLRSSRSVKFTDNNSYATDGSFSRTNSKRQNTRIDFD